MYIIADSGSTKTEWCVLGDDGHCEVHHTSGINPVFLTREHIQELLVKEFDGRREGIKQVTFYGAGCAFEEKIRYVREVLMDFFGTPEVQVESDLLGAARSLCGRKPGIACILGTGSNSCFYDGEKIAANVPSLGYILGDEGSGGALGKRLIADVLKGVLPQAIRDLFFKEYGYSYEELIDRVYRQPLPNRFMAGMTGFLRKYIHIPAVEQLVLDAFEGFVLRNILQYEAARCYPVSFTGGIAYHFREQLEMVLKRNGLVLGTVSRAPMNGLVDYHRSLSVTRC